MNDKQKDSSQNQESFENKNLKVIVTREPGCKVSMEVQLTPLAVEAAYQKAIKKINKEISIPGFRKGKAPAKMVEKNYGGYIDREWKDIIIQTAFHEAIQLTNTFPFDDKSIQKPDLKEIDRKAGGRLILAFESSPQVPEIDPKSIKINQVEKKDVTEKEIEDSLKNICLHHASWEDIEERGVEAGDYIDVDIEDASSPGTFICKDTRFEAAEGQMGEWMLALVLGKKVGETIEGVSERSKELDSDADFTPTQCKITVKAIKVPNLPELDDELAKKMGADSAEDLKKKVISNLQTQAEEDVRHQLRMQIDRLLAKEYPFDLPNTLIESEVQNRLHQLKHNMKNAGHSEEAITSKASQLIDQIKENSKQAFRLLFISQHIAKTHKISVSKEELMREMMMQLYSQSSSIDSSTDPEELRSKIYMDILSQKVKDFLISQASIE